MPGLRDLLLGVLAPALVCGLVLAAVWLARASAAPHSLRRRQLSALAVAAGVAVAYVAIVGMPVLPSASRQLAALDWLPWVLAATTLVALAQLASPLDRLPGSVGIALVVALVVVASFWNPIRRDPPWIDLVTSAAVLFATWQATERLARRVEGAGVPLALLIVASATSVAALLSSSAKLAQLSGALAACLGAATAIALWNARFSLAGGALAVVMAVLGVLWINAVHYASLSPRACALLALAAVAPWAAMRTRTPVRAGSSASRPSRARTVLVCAALAAVPAGLAVFLAHLDAPDTGGY